MSGSGYTSGGVATSDLYVQGAFGVGVLASAAGTVTTKKSSQEQVG